MCGPMSHFQIPKQGLVVAGVSDPVQGTQGRASVLDSALPTPESRPEGLVSGLHGQGEGLVEVTEGVPTRLLAPRSS